VTGVALLGRASQAKRGGVRGFEPGQSKARENEVVIQESYWGARRRFRLVTRQCNEWLHVT